MHSNLFFHRTRKRSFLTLTLANYIECLLSFSSSLQFNIWTLPLLVFFLVVHRLLGVLHRVEGELDFFLLLDGALRHPALLDQPLKLRTAVLKTNRQPGDNVKN